MASLVAEYLASYVGEWLAADTVAAVVTAVEAVEVVTAVYALREQQRRAENRAKDAYNASLKDRYQMVRSATAQRQLVLGRARVSGPMFFIQSYGDKRQNLVFCVALAAHEIDAVEAIYFDDEEVVLNGSGYVTGVYRRENFSLTSSTDTFTLQGNAAAGSITATVAYGSNVITLTPTQPAPNQVRVSGGLSGQTGLCTITYNPDPNPFSPQTTHSVHQSFPIVTGSDTFTLSSAPLANSVALVQEDSLGNVKMLPYTTGTNTVTISGGTVGATCYITYQTADGALEDSLNGQHFGINNNPCYAKVNIHLGAPGQAADADLIAALPSMWTSAHKASGIAYLTVFLSYDQTVFPGGIPNVSALIRGAKLYDPRTSTTAWTDNPALLTRGYATHPLGAGMDASQINDNTVIAAANVCDQQVTYNVNYQNYTLPRYQGGAAYSADVRPQDALTDLCLAMGGRWVLGDGKLRIFAGAYTAPVASLDETWLHDAAAVQVQCAAARSDVVNVITATVADRDQNYQPVKTPRVPPDGSNPYVTEDGKTLPLDMQLNAVQWIGQAQYIAACKVRYGRYGLTVTLTCNMKAYPLEVGDVVNLSLSRFGFVNETFEVTSEGFSIDGGIDLTLKRIDPSIWTMDATFPAFSPLQNTRLPSPLNVPQVVLETAESGTDQLLKMGDGTIVSRILVSWLPVTDAYVTDGGQIEVRYGLATQPDSQWTSVYLPGDAVQTYLSPVLDGAVYVIKARALTQITTGDWSVQLTNQVIGKTAPPSDPTGVTATVLPTGIKISWAQCPDVDYAQTVLHDEVTWNDATTPIWAGTANFWIWNWPPDGTHTVHIKHQDTSGNFSTGGWVVTFHVTGVNVALTSATWYTSTSQAAQWYADVEDDFGNIIGQVPAYWLSDANLPVSLAIDTPQIEPDAATVLAEFSQDTTLLVHGSDVVNVAPGAYQFLENYYASYDNTTTEDLQVEVSLATSWTMVCSSTGWPSDTTVSFDFWIIDQTTNTVFFERATTHNAVEWQDLYFGSGHPLQQAVAQNVLKNITITAGHTVYINYQVYVRASTAPDPAATLYFYPGTGCGRMAVVKR